MRPNKDCESKDMQEYFLKSTSRSVVIEIQNYSDGIFQLQDSLIVHGDDNLITPLPEYIKPKTIFTIGHGSSGFMTGVEGWAKFLERSGVMMKISWMVEFVGVATITLEINDMKVEKKILEESTNNNLMYTFEINNKVGENYLFQMLY